MSGGGNHQDWNGRSRNDISLPRPVFRTGLSELSPRDFPSTRPCVAFRIASSCRVCQSLWNITCIIATSLTLLCNIPLHIHSAPSTGHHIHGHGFLNTHCTPTQQCRSTTAEINAYTADTYTSHQDNGTLARTRRRAGLDASSHCQTDVPRKRFAHAITRPKFRFRRLFATRVEPGGRKGHGDQL